MLTISSDIEGVIKGESLKLDEKYREHFIKEFTLGIDEIEIIKFFVDNIKKMLQKSELLSSETLGTLSYSIPFVRMLKNEFLNIKNGKCNLSI